MLGSIHTDLLCPVCKGKFKLDENRNAMFCADGHTEIAHFGKCRVFFKKTTSRFHTVMEALQKLQYLRVQFQNGTYDPRDYAKDLPLGFSKLADQWLETREGATKRKTLSGSTLRNYRNYMRRFKPERRLQRFYRGFVPAIETAPNHPKSTPDLSSLCHVVCGPNHERKREWTSI